MTLTLMPMAVAIESHGQNSHVATHFDCLDIRNLVVPLTMLMASCDVNISDNGKDLTNAVLQLTMSSASHAAYVNASGSS